MTSGAAFQRSHLIFLALEGLSAIVFVAGFLLELRPLLWLSGLLGSAALWFLLQSVAEMARMRGRPNTMPGVVVVFPALVMFGLSFFVM
ncbi:hypothetical protein V3W47_00915 [Deinococcus sp. YIM 134068]|uniref:hypothetical protein n=1 Tax=Deinococcus lichenicola TaxID=3118910 RepID=UPI002F9520FF